MATGAPLSLRYHSDQLNNKLVSMMREFYLTGEFCDVVLHVGSLTIQAHRTVLASFSPYFRDLFHQPSNKHKTDITLGGHLRDESVRQLVDFCYSSNITVDTQSADKILTAANFLQIKEIEKLCITFLAAQQALRSEAIQQQPPPTIFVPTATVSTHSPSVSLCDKQSRSDSSRELAFADTSGIGSSNTSPRQLSRPNSVPSGNGSVIMQTVESPEGEITGDISVHVKKEHIESPSDAPVFTPGSTFSWARPPFDNFRSAMPSFPGFLFPPLTSAFSLPATTSTMQHQLLMKALTTKAPERPEPPESGELYTGRYSSSSSVIKEEQSGAGNQSEGEETNSQAELSPTLQCHICLKQFQSNSTLRSHVITDHKDDVTSPISPYKMMSPVRKMSTEGTSSSNGGLSTQQSVSGEGDYGGKNMCGTCGKSFRDPQSLKFHRYNHVLRYQCNYCGKRFSRSWNLHRHRKTHYRQLQEAGLASDDVNIIDVDSEPGNQNTQNCDMDKDLILTSPYIDYRNHRHDMMPFAFDLRKSTPACTYGLDENKNEETKYEETKSPPTNEIEQTEPENLGLKDKNE